ncbi:hypothetical protein CRE_05113 [Caenorhabditis remanei]|uniref:Uncharacterized protein n=1 Tax=Caenorhabditis remanei TaxID=31234 RepID=E3N695_CAERE|nr:hypothetical protein CRE_05113 [Caenorhabditis remanei]
MGEVNCDWFADEQHTKTELFFSRRTELTTCGTDVVDHVDYAGFIGLAYLLNFANPYLFLH